MGGGAVTLEVFSHLFLTPKGVFLSFYGEGRSFGRSPTKLSGKELGV